MANYIIRILRTQIVIFLSWGPSCLIEIENGLVFNVNGFLHQGKVEITYNTGWDLFDVRLINKDGTVKQTIEGIYADGLVSTIDMVVEKTEHYKERVIKEYSIKK